MVDDARFRLIAPDAAIADLVDCFWTVDDPDATPREQKIIPDGFPELIFHHGAPYDIRLRQAWARQQRSLFAGQITRHFFLRNTGPAAMTGVKLQPWAAAHLFGVRMDAYRDRVEPLRNVGHGAVLEAAASAPGDASARIAALTSALQALRPAIRAPAAVMDAVRLLCATHGMSPIADVCARIGVGERSLERAFRRHIGLGPKRYARILRFSTIFRVARGEGVTLSDLSFQAGYYDQPHFHREFKAFTGENPSEYLFGQANMANLFLDRP